MASKDVEIEQLDIERKRLELDKLRAEIAETSLAWWKRPGYLGSLAPIVLALVGVGTAWITGYFDTQRQQLATEIAILEEEKSGLQEDKTALEQEKLELAQSLEQAQLAIDLRYLQVRMAAEGAAYALGHFNAFSGEFSEAVATILKYQDSLPEESLGALNQMLDMSADRFNAVQYTHEHIRELLSQLEQIEVSPWAKELTTEPFLSSKGLFEAPDGRLFDLAKERFLTQEEAQSARQ